MRVAGRVQGSPAQLLVSHQALPTSHLGNGWMKQQRLVLTTAGPWPRLSRPTQASVERLPHDRLGTARARCAEPAPTG